LSPRKRSGRLSSSQPLRVMAAIASFVVMSDAICDANKARSERNSMQDKWQAY
jgi:hypothetical protein